MADLLLTADFLRVVPEYQFWYSLVNQESRQADAEISSYTHNFRHHPYQGTTQRQQHWGDLSWSNGATNATSYVPWHGQYASGHGFQANNNTGVLYGSTTIVPCANSFMAKPTGKSEFDHPFYQRRAAEPKLGPTRTRDKYRVVYTEKQRQGLERAYEDTKFISAEKKQQLAKDLDLSQRQVKNKNNYQGVVLLSVT